MVVANYRYCQQTVELVFVTADTRRTNGPETNMIPNRNKFDKIVWLMVNTDDEANYSKECKQPSQLGNERKWSLAAKKEKKGGSQQRCRRCNG